MEPFEKLSNKVGQKGYRALAVELCNPPKDEGSYGYLVTVDPNLGPPPIEPSDDFGMDLKELRRIFNL